MIDCGSKDSISSYMKLLNKFKIRYVSVYDLDHQAGKNADAIDTADKSSRIIEESKDNTFGNTVILENDIEEEIGITAVNKSKPYIAVKHVTAEDFIVSPNFKTKVELIYS